MERLFSHLWYWRVVRDIWLGSHQDLHANKHIFLHFSQLMLRRQKKYQPYVHGVLTGGKNKKRKWQLMKRGAAGKMKKDARRRQGGRSKGEGKGPADNGELRVDGEGRWQRMKLYTHNDPAALYRADKAAWQQMKLHEADPDVVAYQEIRLQGKDNVVCAQMYDKEGREYQREWAQGVPLLVRRGLSVVQDKKVGARG